MSRRAGILPTAALLLLALAALTGCASNAPGAFTRTLAQADNTKWTAQAVAAAGLPAPRASTKLSGFEACRTDTGFFITSTEWRTITDIAAPLARQAAVTAGIARSFESSGWKLSKPQGFVTLAGGGKRKGLIIVQSAGHSALEITVFSPCYS